MPEERTTLTADQQRVLVMIYERFYKPGNWPTFGEVDRPIRKLGLRPEQIIADLVREGMLLPFQAGRFQPIGRDELRLTLKGLASCEDGKIDVSRLLQLLPWLAIKELSFEPGPEQPDASLRVSGTEIAKFLRLSMDSCAFQRLHRLIELQRWGFSGGELEGEWYTQVDRNIYRFERVTTLEDYEAIMQQWEDEGKRLYVTIPDSFYGSVDTFGDAGPTPEPEPEPYITARVVDQLESLAEQSSWDCTKLLALIKELNDSYCSGMTYAAHALLRAILDHVPPLLGYKNFDTVVNNYHWTHTDKRYIKRLTEFRAQADDVLHRQISKTADLLTIDDMPQRVAVNRLLQECISAVMAAQPTQSVP